MSVTDRLRDGQAFGRYQIVRLIGEGGMGAVYEAIHPALKKRFAIKTLLPSIVEKEEARVRFLREGEAAASINHPNVVAVTDVGTEEGVPYLVMELLEGQTLADLLGERRSLGPDEAVGLLLPVISAVATGHSRGVIHRDLKPQNIFLAKGPWGERIPKVLDFGVSKLTAADDSAVITRTLTVLGTAAYMSPEQARGARRVDFQSDQYSLGLILYEMLTGTRAHPGENSLEILHNVASGVIRPVREVRPDLSGDLDAVLTRMLARAPTERYPSLHECGRDLLRFANDKIRMALTDAFSVSENRSVPSGSAPKSSERSPPSSGSGAGGTMPLPVDVSDTTMRQAAAERANTAGKSRPSVFRVRAALAVGIGIALVVGAVVWATARREASTVVATATDQEQPLQPYTGGAPKPPPSTVEAPHPTIPFEIRTLPTDADIRLDDRPPTRGRLEIVLPLAGASHDIRVSAAGYVSKTVSFGANDRPPSEISLDREPAAESPRTTSAERVAKVKDLPSPKPDRVTRTPKIEKKIEPAKPDDATDTVKRGANNAIILR